MSCSTRGNRWRPTRALLSFALATASSASAQVIFTVDSVLDQIDDDTADGICHTAANTCTLRAAVMQANLASGAGATILLPAATYGLVRPASGDNGPDNGDLNLTTPAVGNPVISIVGTGEATTIIDANQIDRVLSVAPGRTATLSRLTLRNGYLSEAGHYGAGILNRGALTLDHCTVTANSTVLLSSSSGGIDHAGGSLHLNDSTVSANSSRGLAGGIYTLAPLFLLRSTIDGNTAENGAGGGIFATAELTITDSTISRNTSRHSHGGGIRSSSPLVISNSTVTLNKADGSGGGISATDADIYSSTIAFNGADVDHVDGGIGGGIYVPSGSVRLSNTMVVGNTLFDSPTYDDCYGAITSYRSNLFWEVSGGCTISVGGGDGWGYLNSLGLLAPPQKNGGATETIALLPGSNAIDLGDSTLGCTGPTGPPLLTDQRGVPRVAGSRCDVGAFEEGILFFDGFESGDLSAW